jgi:hypothetical protein
MTPVVMGVRSLMVRSALGLRGIVVVRFGRRRLNYSNSI